VSDPADRRSAAPARSDPTRDIVDWLMGEGRFLPRSRDLIGGLCDRLVEAGVPVARVLVSIRTIHPQILTMGYQWRRGAETAERELGYDMMNDPAYLRSPVKVIHDGAGGLRRRLSDPSVAEDFPILGELRAQGYTDYVAMPLHFSDGKINSVTWASDRPEGFGVDHLSLIYELLTPLALCLEIQAMRQIAATLLDTYIGHQAGERVLEGHIQRGDAETIHAVLCYSDLRGFTAMSDAMPRDELVAMLNDYFERMVAAVHGHGGQVLKFLGDGLFAIFPLRDAAFRYYVCRQAIRAATDAQAAIDALNAEREAAGKPPIRFGLALHLGDMVYGNIGGLDRLDFTAIGPSVNLTARLEKLSGELEVPVVMSSEFARTAPGPLVSLGRHLLRGVSEPQEVFTLAELAAAS